MSHLRTKLLIGWSARAQERERDVPDRYFDIQILNECTLYTYNTKHTTLKFMILLTAVYTYLWVLGNCLMGRVQCKLFLQTKVNIIMYQIRSCSLSCS